MNRAIQNPARCVLHSVTSPLFAESSRAIEIYGWIVAFMVKMVWQDRMWLNEFVCWRNKERKFMMWSGEGILPFSATKYCESPENIRKDRCLTIDKLHALCSVISRTVLKKREIWVAGNFLFVGTKNIDWRAQTKPSCDRTTFLLRFENRMKSFLTSLLRWWNLGFTHNSKNQTAIDVVAAHPFIISEKVQTFAAVGQKSHSDNFVGHNQPLLVEFM